MSDDEDEDDDPFFDDEGLDDEDDEVDDGCGICGGDHADQNCDTSFCAVCWEIVDNCDCDEGVMIEVSAQEWIAKGRPKPLRSE